MIKHMPKVALVIGHSWKKQGSESDLLPQTEWQLNEKFVWKIARKLISQGIVVPHIIYREHGYGKLPEEINGYNCDLIVSHHFNAFSKESANGTEVLYYAGSKRSKKIANIFQDKISKALKTRNRGLRPVTYGMRGARVLRETNAPCVLLEPIFLTNKKDVELFKANQIEYVNAVVSAIYKSLENLL